MLLNEYSHENTQLLLHADGGASEVDFTYGSGADIWKSCSVKFQGEIYVFGGTRTGKQISKVGQCRLDRIGQLNTNMIYGDCTNFNDEYIVMCFDQWECNKCYKASGPLETFEPITDSHYEHCETQIAALDEVIAVGSHRYLTH